MSDAFSASFDILLRQLGDHHAGVSLAGARAID
jgi:hypothetical protein